MIRACTIIACLALVAGCSGPVSAPRPAVSAQAPDAAVVRPDLSDGTAVPLAVITSLPQGVSATSVIKQNGCYSYDTGQQIVPVTSADGIQICRG